MATCYPPLSVNVSSIDFNAGNTGYQAAYITPDPSCQPAECNLPALITNDLNVSGVLTTPQGGCKYTFNNVFPIPPIHIPKININIPCPQGVTFESAITIVGSGSASTTGSISVVGGPCNFVIGGIIDINVPTIPCSSGTNFSSSVSNDPTQPNSLNVVGGPCNFALVGNIGGGGGGNDVAATCLDCTATCCQVRTNIQSRYSTLGTTPKQGDIISLCNFVYEVVGSPSPTSTCDGSCPLASTTQVIDFTVEEITYYARQISNNCPKTPFYVVLSPSGASLTVLPGNLSQFPTSSSISITSLNTSISSINSNDLVWLELTVSGLSPTAAKICTTNNLGPSGIVFSSPTIAQFDGSTPPNQTYAQYPIATITSSISLQSCFNNLNIVNTAIGGNAAIYPEPV